LIKEAKTNYVVAFIPSIPYPMY